MKITEKWLKEHHACETGFPLYNEIGETDVIKILDALIKKDKKCEARWLIEKAFGEKRIVQYLGLYGVKIITYKIAKIWAKKEGFTFIRQNDYFGRYFKVDDGFGIMIKWHYDDSSDYHCVKWQAWIDNNKERPKMIKRYPIPNREDGIFLEAETENQRFTGFYDNGFNEMMVYIKENNDKMIKVLKDNINKRLKKLQD